MKTQVEGVGHIVARVTMFLSRDEFDKVADQLPADDQRNATEMLLLQHPDADYFRITIIPMTYAERLDEEKSDD